MGCVEITPRRIRTFAESIIPCIPDVQMKKNTKSSTLTKGISRSNYYSFLWHAVFLALAKNFMDVDTIIPAMMIDSGGTSLHVGLTTAILLGGSKFAQLFFASFINNARYKKGYLLLGIHSRFFSLLALAFLFWFSGMMEGSFVIAIIFLFITIFSVSGAFANIGYTDILGKSVRPESRKSYFSIRQVISSIGMFVSAFLAARLLADTDYPVNYAALFGIAASALGIASLGFWNLREVAASQTRISSPGRFVAVIRQEIRRNKRFRHYLMLVNTQGVVLSLMPFLLLYAKDHFDSGNDVVGHFLLFKVTGGVIIGSLLFWFSRRVRYQNMLYITSLLAFIIPVYVMLGPGPSLFALSFLAGGIVFTLHNISINGVLLEVSNNENRALYTGLSGAGNILPAVFPLLGGWIIQQFGFPMFFSLFMAVLAASVYFVYRLQCRI